MSSSFSPVPCQITLHQFSVSDRDLVGVLCVSVLSLPLVPVPDDVPSGTSPSKGGCVVRHRHEDTHREFNPANRHELFLKFSLSAKGRRSTDPITNLRAKVRMSPGMALDAFKPTFQSIFQPPPPFNTKQDSSPSDRPRKTKLLTFTPLMSITTIYTNKYMDI